MNIEDLSASEIESMEAEKASRMSGYNNKETTKHHGTYEDLSASEIESMEAEIRARRYETRDVEQHYGSVENLSDTELNIMEAQVSEKRKQDAPYKDYFNNLVNTLDISDQAEFKAAVLKSMQSNGIMKKFVDELCEKITSKTTEMKNIDKNDKESIQDGKKELEKMISVYEKYMYTLKENQWDFSNLDSMKLPEYVTENLWQQQKRLDIDFKMPIPADMGEYYGEKFQRDGKLIPGLTLMYDDLSGKKVDWHRVMIYKEGELTPQQRYRQRLLESIREKREDLSNKQEELSKLRAEKEQGGISYGE